MYISVLCAQHNQTPYVYMCVIGHVDSGKSTLVGQLSVASGNINAKTTRNLQKIADNNSKSSFALAYAMDSTESERKRGVTIDVGSAQIIELDSYNLALLGLWFYRLHFTRRV